RRRVSHDGTPDRKHGWLLGPGLPGPVPVGALALGADPRLPALLPGEPLVPAPLALPAPHNHPDLPHAPSMYPQLSPVKSYTARLTEGVPPRYIRVRYTRRSGEWTEGSSGGSQ